MRPVNEATAILFYQLCLGDRCISQLLSAHNVATLDEFRAFLSQVTEQLAPPAPVDGIDPVDGTAEN